MEEKEVEELEIKDETKEEKQEVKEEFEEVEIKQNPQNTRTDSYFDGTLLELIGWRLLCFLLGAVTLGIGIPWAECMMYNYRLKHTVYNGKRLKFEGTGGDLFVNKFKWFFFTIITCGIYAWFIPVRKTKWVISNIHFEDEEFKKEESFFDGSTLGLIGVNLLTRILTVLSLGILYPFMVCYKLKWINKHTVINEKKLVFSGKGINLLGKYLLWSFLTLITFGIYGFWLHIKMIKWETKNIHIKKVGEEEEKSSLGILLLIPVAIIGIIAVGALLFGILRSMNISSYIKDNDVYSVEEDVKGLMYCKDGYRYNKHENICFYYDFNLTDEEECRKLGFKPTSYIGRPACFKTQKARKKSKSNGMYMEENSLPIQETKEEKKPEAINNSNGNNNQTPTGPVEPAPTPIEDIDRSCPENWYYREDINKCVQDIPMSSDECMAKGGDLFTSWDGVDTCTLYLN